MGTRNARGVTNASPASDRNGVYVEERSELMEGEWATETLTHSTEYNRESCYCTSTFYYNARKSAALNCLRTMQCAGSALPDPSFFSPPFLFYAVETFDRSPYWRRVRDVEQISTEINLRARVSDDVIDHAAQPAAATPARTHSQRRPSSRNLRGVTSTSPTTLKEDYTLFLKEYPLPKFFGNNVDDRSFQTLTKGDRKLRMRNFLERMVVGSQQDGADGIFGERNDDASQRQE
ncbi:hypothetical protein EVAR_68791_1 [Eumeta japonica]|uniref:Uncharacterized protein n=1 Tax=Eumeta variegata TaxID=151549 RepID=A0A4C1ZAY4_EUMVA|nr:hypothetical protein EVAR_68791_1 [Eumeta japonica]